MHSYWQRANTVITFAGTVLAAVAIATAATDLLHFPKPSANIKLTSIRQLTSNTRGNDQALLNLAFEADLTSAFSWNTKQLFVYIQAEYQTSANTINQVSLWDKIIERKEDAKLVVKRLKQKYAFVDKGKNLRGKEFNLTLTYNVMPRVGFLYTQSVKFPGNKFPEEYKY